MGEPLHNYENLVRAIEIFSEDFGFGFSSRRLTVSTSGLVPGIRRFIREGIRANLAVSLNAVNDELRSRLMPVNRRWNIEALLEACRQVPAENRYRITFEYVLMDGLTDSLEHAHKLVRLLLALVEAGSGRIGAITDQIALLCYHFDPTKGRYTLTIVRVLDAVIAVFLAACALFAWRFLRRRARAAALSMIPTTTGAASAVGEALAACGLAPLATRVERLDDADWVALTQRQFEPIRAGERLWIVPTWHAPPEPGAVNVILDPGAAFGTGSHPTTRLCLAWLEGNVRPGDAVLDYGCGSGILAICAMKLGAAQARAVDIDPLALEAARYNALRNNVRVAVIDARRAVPGGAHITVANILANPLRMLAPTLASHTQPGGSIALSGILEAQASEVIAAYEPWARLEASARDSGWVLLAGERSAEAC